MNTNWYEDALNQLKCTFKDSGLKDTNGFEFIIDYFTEFPPQEESDSEYTEEDIEQIARDVIDDFQQWLATKADDWLYIAEGYLWIYRERKTEKATREEVEEEFIISNEQQIVLDKDVDLLDENDADILEELYQKVQTIPEKMLISDCALKLAQYHGRISKLPNHELAKKWEIAGEKAKEADKPGFHRNFEKAADLYAISSDNIKSADLYEKAVIHSPKSKDNYIDIDWVILTARKARVQNDLSGDSISASRMFIKENNAKLQKVKGVGRPIFWLYKVLSDYGQSPYKVAMVSAAVILICASLYTLFGIKSSATSITVNSFFTSLYYSAVTFTTLGYGDYSPCGPYTKIISGVEAVCGLLLTSLFMVTFVRKYSR